jgi:hypothetical protein
MLPACMHACLFAGVATSIQQIQGCSALDELAFLHKPSSTLILTDLAFNLSKSDQRVGLLSKLYLSWYGGFQPCCVTSAFKGLFNDPGESCPGGVCALVIVVCECFDAVQPVLVNARSATALCTCVWVNALVISSCWFEMLATTLHRLGFMGHYFVASSHRPSVPSRVSCQWHQWHGCIFWRLQGSERLVKVTCIHHVKRRGGCCNIVPLHS